MDDKASTATQTTTTTATSPYDDDMAVYTIFLCFSITKTDLDFQLKQNNIGLNLYTL